MVIIGAGRVGMALHSRAAERGVACGLIRRSEGWEQLEQGAGGPVLVATRNDDLDGVVERVPVHRRQDLVFVQNGMLRPWLQERALSRATRGLLFFAVPHRGAPIEPGPASPFTGSLAVEVVRWLGALGLPAEAVDWPRFGALELEKLIWNCAFGLLCERFDRTVGEVCAEQDALLRALVAELRAVGRAAMSVDLPQEWLVDRLVSYSRSIPDYQGSVKEWRWRNGWFLRAAEEHGLSTPVHRQLLHAVRAQAEEG